MTRNEVTELLRLRWRLTEQQFGDDRVAAWTEVLAHHDLGRIRARMVTLVRQGATRIELGDLTGGIKPAEHHDHERPTHNHAGHEYIAWSDPRAQAAFRDGYRRATGHDWQGDDPTGAAA